MYYRDGTIYEGEWYDDQRNGQGMLRLSMIKQCLFLLHCSLNKLYFNLEISQIRNHLIAKLQFARRNCLDFNKFNYIIILNTCMLSYMIYTTITISALLILKMIRNYIFSYVHAELLYPSQWVAGGLMFLTGRSVTSVLYILSTAFLQNFFWRQLKTLAKIYCFVQLV